MRIRTIVAISALLLSGCKSDGSATSDTGDGLANAKITVCPDGTIIKGNKACPTAPTHPPSPAPAAAPSTATVLATSLLGAAAIADNFDATTWLEPGEARSPITDGSPGAFRFTCLAGQISRDDPIVYPGQPGKSHLHQFFGNTGTNASSDYQSLRTTGGSTCTRSTGSSPQRSAYWMPAMLDGAGNVVKPDFVNTYYKQLPANDPRCSSTVVSQDNRAAGPSIGKCVPMPNGLRFILGYNMATMSGGPADMTSRDWEAMGFDCMDRPVGANSYTGIQRTMAAILATGRCPAGAYLRVYLTFPQCWDGKNLDSPDHRAHIVQPPQSICPQTHPYKVPEIAIQAFFSVDQNFFAGKWRLASDEMMPGVAAGTTLHMDYWEAWSPTIKDIWQKNCVDGPSSCSAGNVGDGRQIKGMQQVGAYPIGVKVPLSSI